MLKKITGIMLCVFMIITVGTTAFAENNYPKNVPEAVRCIDGLGEMLSSLFGYMSLKRNYPDCHNVCSIPELENNYVPQGFCYVDCVEMFAITYYSADGDNSIISLVDKNTGERVKTVKLIYQNETDCHEHVGGVGDMGKYLIVSTGKSVRRIKINDILQAQDYSKVKFCGKLNTDMQASYICTYENKLFVGQFYTFTLEGTYDTPAEQRVFTPTGKRNYAMCEEYDLTDMEKVFSDGKAVPERMISMPNNVQGIAYDGKYFVTSSSATENSASKIRYYELKETEYMFNIRENDVPLYFITEKEACNTVKIPPLAEGIDFCDGQVMGIFESGAKKFSSSAVKTPYICVFDK